MCGQYRGRLGTVVKNSDPFSFPLSVGVLRNTSPHEKDNSFACRTFGAGRRSVELSWALPATAGRGTIALFNVAGACIKTFAVNSPVGSVIWNGMAGSAIRSGVYVARFSWGSSYRRNLKIFVY